MEYFTTTEERLAKICVEMNRLFVDNLPMLLSKNLTNRDTFIFVLKHIEMTEEEKFDLAFVFTDVLEKIVVHVKKQVTK